MLNEISKITFDGIRDAAAAGESITVIINGEYYDIDTMTPGAVDPDEAFIDGVNFTLAALEDNRARANSLFEGYRTIQCKQPLKKDIAINQALNAYTRQIIDFMHYIIKPEAGFNTRYQEYKNNKLWRLRT